MPRAQATLILRKHTVQTVSAKAQQSKVTPTLRKTVTNTHTQQNLRQSGYAATTHATKSEQMETTTATNTNQKAMTATTSMNSGAQPGLQTQQP